MSILWFLEIGSVFVTYMTLESGVHEISYRSPTMITLASDCIDLFGHSLWLFSFHALLMTATIYMLQHTNHKPIHFALLNLDVRNYPTVHSLKSYDCGFISQKPLMLPNIRCSPLHSSCRNFRDLKTERYTRDISKQENVSVMSQKWVDWTGQTKTTLRTSYQHT